ncbi:hypothetical protein Nepgr_013601 [Nepenthes gracilis]|uniref:Uncharacterized protein n=1 Tax=Nepenthes gracilis TaxID=150966 RepID=A0AAD3XPJ9_NEPGR|nr:hypothetical protein Nepgr_013601 [Nepenthes gracilis]
MDLVGRWKPQKFLMCFTTGLTQMTEEKQIDSCCDHLSHSYRPEHGSSVPDDTSDGKRTVTGDPIRSPIARQTHLNWFSKLLRD